MKKKLVKGSTVIRVSGRVLEHILNNAVYFRETHTQILERLLFGEELAQNGKTKLKRTKKAA